MKVDLGPYSDGDRENEEHDFLDRRVEIRIDDYDTFAVDRTLSLIIVSILNNCQTKIMKINLMIIMEMLFTVSQTRKEFAI